MSTPTSASPLSGASTPPEVPGYSLFNHQSVGLAAFFGSPVAGAVLMAVNYRRLGKGSAAVAAVVAGVLLTAVLLAIPLTSSRAPVGALPMVAVIAVFYAAKNLQGPAVEQHVRSGGRLGSRWAAFGLGMVFLVVIGIGILLVVFHQPDTP